MRQRRAFQSQTDYAHETLHRWILDGTLKPGERLVLDRLAERLGLSTIPLREALRLLDHERLVVRGKGRGWSVVAMGEEDARQIGILREALESESARRCAVAAGPEEIERLRELAEQLDVLMMKGGARVAREFEWRFHGGVASVAGCPVLHDEIVRALVVLQSSIEGDVNPKMHKELVEAIATGDRDTAEEAMRQHVAWDGSEADEEGKDAEEDGADGGRVVVSEETVFGKSVVERVGTGEGGKGTPMNDG